MAFALKFMSSSNVLAPIYSPNDIDEMIADFYQGSLNALEASRYQSSAQILHIQVTQFDYHDCAVLTRLLRWQLAIHYVLFLFVSGRIYPFVKLAKTHLQHFGSSAEQNKLALRHVDSAITTAQWLNLDILCPESPVLPVDDLAISGLTMATSIELCKRLIHTLSLIDGTVSSRIGTWRLAHGMFESCSR